MGKGMLPDDKMARDTALVLLRLPPSMVSVDSSPAANALMRYAAAREGISAAGDITALKGVVRQAEEDFELRRTIRRISDFMERAAASGDAVRIALAPKDARDGKEVVLGPEGIRRLPLPTIRKLARVLEENYGMRPDGEPPAHGAAAEG